MLKRYFFCLSQVVNDNEEPERHNNNVLVEGYSFSGPLLLSGLAVAPQLNLQGAGVLGLLANGGLHLGRGHPDQAQGLDQILDNG